MALPVAVDAELLAVRYLRARSEVAALVAERVYTELPPAPAWPLLVVVRIAGTLAWPGWLDVARLQIDAWADRKFAAAELASTARAALFEMPGVHDLGVVDHVEQDLGLRWAPDPESDRPRYVFGVAVYLHPTP